MHHPKRTIILFISLLSISLLNFTFIKSSNFRELQTTTNVNSCTKTVPSETGKECFPLSNSSLQCCLLEFKGKYYCSAQEITPTLLKQLNAGGISDISKFKSYTSRPDLKMFATCANADPFPASVISKVNNCGAISFATNEACSQYDSKESRCCLLKSGRSVESLSSICSGWAASYTHPDFSYALNIENLVYLYSCGSSDSEIMQMEACAAVKNPGSESACAQKSKGSVSCLFGRVTGVSFCVGIKGNLSLAKDLNLAPNLQGLEINNYSDSKFLKSFSYLFALLIGLVLV